MTAARTALQTQINPRWVDSDSYVAFLNRVFPGQWDRGAYDWYMARDFNGVKSDLLVRAEGDRILAGMVIGSRQIRVGAGGPIDVCIVSAAATLPGERRRGHYAALLQTALEYSRQKGCVALLGFVTRDNGSGRELMRLGSRAIPSFYILSGARARIRHGLHPRATLTTSIAQRPVALESVLACWERQVAPSDPSIGPAAHFYYGRVEDWKRQFLHRPHSVRAVRLAHDSLALVESVRSTDRMQWLGCPGAKTVRNIVALAAGSAAAGRQFFMYTLDSLLAAAARRVGLKVRDGYFMALPTGYSRGAWDELARASWSVQSGDRI